MAMTETAGGSSVPRWRSVVAAPGELEAMPWGHESPCFSALGHEFVIRSTSPAVGEFVSDLYRPMRCETPTKAPVVYSLVDRGPGVAERFQFYEGRRRLRSSASAATILGALVWSVNHQAVEVSGNRVNVHAAAAERQGHAVVLPAPMESGKTTLVAGLVRTGLRYVTDETVSVDPETLTITPFPKPMPIDPGSWDVLADLEPEVLPEVSPWVEQQWQIPAHAIRPGAVSPACRPVLLIAPRYIAGAGTRIEPAKKSEMVKLLVESTFRFKLHARRNLTVLARLAEGCPCYYLVVGDLDAACALVTEAFDDVLTRGEHA